MEILESTRYEITLKFSRREMNDIDNLLAVCHDFFSRRNEVQESFDIFRDVVSKYVKQEM